MAIVPIVPASKTPSPRLSPRERARAPSPAPEAPPPAAPLDEPEQAEAKAAATYEVGYKKPPTHTRFRPGRSGNPRGRPKGSKGLNTLIRESLSEMVIARTARGEKKISRIQGIIHKLQEMALKGNVRALTQLMAYYSAAVPDALETSGPAAPQDLSATDQAILAEYMASMSSEGDSQ